MQHLMSGRLAALGPRRRHVVHTADETLAQPDFPGVEVDRREGWGVVGRLPGDGGGPSLMLNAHVDVVPPGDLDAWQGHDPFGGAVTADAVHGRGACDMKAGLVASLWAVRALSELRVPLGGDLMLATVIGEEDGGLGTYALLRRGWRADACVIPEPTSLDIAPASCGALTFGSPSTAPPPTRRVAWTGERHREVHPHLPRAPPARARAQPAKHPLAERWDLPVPIEVGRIAAGDWASSVPDLLRADGRMGVAIGEDVATARESSRTAVAQAAPTTRGYAGTPPRPLVGRAVRVGDAPTSTVHLGVVRRRTPASRPTPQGPWATPYGSDLRLLHGLGGIPTIHYGPGTPAWPTARRSPSHRRAAHLDQSPGPDRDRVRATVLTVRSALGLEAEAGEEQVEPGPELLGVVVAGELVDDLVHERELVGVERAPVSA